MYHNTNGSPQHTLGAFRVTTNHMKNPKTHSESPN